MKRALLALALLILVSCSGSGPTAPPPATVNFAGAWNASFSVTNCARWQGSVVVAQTGNVITLSIPEQHATITGTISGSTASFTLTICGASASGSGVVGPSLIDSSFAGALAVFPWSCNCQYGTQPTGSFNLSR